MTGSWGAQVVTAVRDYQQALNDVLETRSVELERPDGSIEVYLINPTEGLVSEADNQLGLVHRQFGGWVLGQGYRRGKI